MKERKVVPQGNATRPLVLPLTLPPLSRLAFIPSNSIPREHLHEARDGLRIARRRKRDVNDDRQTPIPKLSSRFSLVLPMNFFYVYKSLFDLI